MDTESVVGKVGRVTVPINGENLGQVMINARGGTDAYLAYSDEASSSAFVGRKSFVVGDKVVITEQLGRQVGVRTAPNDASITPN